MANIYQGATIQDAQAILDRLAAKAREVTGQTVSPEPGDAASLMDRARYDRYAGDLDKAAMIAGVAAMHALLARAPAGAAVRAEDVYAPIAPPAA